MIRQFDVVRNPLVIGRTDRPYLTCIQHLLYEHMTTRVMAALVTPDAIKPVPRLNPEFQILDLRLYLMPMDITTIPLRRLGPPLANLEADRERIIAALDLVVTGI